MDKRFVVEILPVVEELINQLDEPELCLNKQELKDRASALCPLPLPDDLFDLAYDLHSERYY